MAQLGSVGEGPGPLYVSLPPAPKTKEPVGAPSSPPLSAGASRAAIAVAAVQTLRAGQLLLPVSSTGWVPVITKLPSEELSSFIKEFDIAYRTFDSDPTKESAGRALVNAFEKIEKFMNNDRKVSGLKDNSQYVAQVNECKSKREKYNIVLDAIEKKMNQEKIIVLLDKVALAREAYRTSPYSPLNGGNPNLRESRRVMDNYQNSQTELQQFLRENPRIRECIDPSVAVRLRDLE